jgi:hypothetical protein
MSEAKETIAHTVVPASDGMGIPPAVQGGGAVGIAVSLVGAIFWLRRRLSSDNLGVKQDSANATLMKTLQEERDKAMKAAEEAWAMRTRDAVLIGELTGKVNHLLEVNETLRSDISSVRKEMQDLRLLIKTILPIQLGDAVLKGGLSPADVMDHLNKQAKGGRKQ